MSDRVTPVDRTTADLIRHEIRRLEFHGQTGDRAAIRDICEKVYAAAYHEGYLRGTTDGWDDAAAKAPEAAPEPEKRYDASEGAYFVLGTDLALDGSSTLSLHWNGKDRHLRVQHDQAGEYEVAVLTPRDAARLAEALSEQAEDVAASGDPR